MGSQCRECRVRECDDAGIIWGRPHQSGCCTLVRGVLWMNLKNIR